VAFNQVLISDFYRYPLKRLIGVAINPDSKPLTNIKKLLQSLGYEFGRDERAIAKHKSSGMQILAISDLHNQILAAWLNRDAQKSVEKVMENQPEVIATKNAETQIPRREFPNDLIYREFPTEISACDQFPMVNSDLDKNEAVLPPVRSPKSVIPKLKQGLKVIFEDTFYWIKSLQPWGLVLETISGWQCQISQDEVAKLQI